jgi:urease accessory protein
LTRSARAGADSDGFGARITRSDFPPPPELSDRDPAQAPDGHVGGLRAELHDRDGETHLGRVYYQNPVRVIRPLTPQKGGPSLLYLMNMTAGLLDGDGQLVALDVGPGVRCFATNQSAGRVHPCPRYHAASRYDLNVAGGSVLCLLPGPMIPFVGSRYHQKTSINLDPGAQVVWGDVLLPGRTLYSKAPERFVFDRIVQELHVRRGGRLVFHERFSWAGPWDEAQTLWHFGDAEAAASLFISGPVAPEDLPSLPDGEIAVQETAFGDTCVRLLGRDAEQVIAAAALVALTACARLAGEESGTWLLHSTGLSSVHWFSTPPAADAAQSLPG